MPPSILRTDDGHMIDLELDPPATVTREAKAAVRRWRMARIRRNFPCLLPMSPDDCDLAGSPSGRTATLDLTNVLDKLLRSRAGTKDFPDWRVSYRPDLISAISGGQWSQARLASTRKWTDDHLCQLCSAAQGTLLHRHHCPTTTPYGGWPRPTEAVQTFLDKISPERKELLTTRGLLGLAEGLPAA